MLGRENSIFFVVWKLLFEIVQLKKQCILESLIGNSDYQLDIFQDILLEFLIELQSVYTPVKFAGKRALPCKN